MYALWIGGWVPLLYSPHLKSSAITVNGGDTRGRRTHGRIIGVQFGIEVSAVLGVLTLESNDLVWFHIKGNGDINGWIHSGQCRPETEYEELCATYPQLPPRSWWKIS